MVLSAVSSNSDGPARSSMPGVLPGAEAGVIEGPTRRRREPSSACDALLLALQAAGEADDPLLGSAILAHMAFIPGWAGDRDAALERMIAARTYARRAPASAEFRAWLDAVEAECETRCGDARTALHLIGHAEDVLATGNEHPSPEWMDWFSLARLAAFKGKTQLIAGHLPQARDSLLGVLDEMPSSEDERRSVVFGDLAAVEGRFRKSGAGVHIRGTGSRSAGAHVVRHWHGPCARGTARARAASARALRTRPRRPALRMVDDGQRAEPLKSTMRPDSSRRLPIRNVGSSRASELFHWIVAQGPRRTSAVCIPASTAGRMSLSQRSPT